jgi:hypothetical protein
MGSKGAGVKMEIYRKAEVFTTGKNPILLATSQWCTVQQDENNRPQLILKDFDTDSLSVHGSVDIILYSELGISQTAGIVTFIVAYTQANFLITQWGGRIERRNNLKVRVEIRGNICAERDDDSWFDYTLPIPVELQNLSAGGALFLTTAKLEPGFCGSLIVPIVPFPLVFHILRRNDGPSVSLYAYGCRFEPLLPHADALLCSYIYQRQVQLRSVAGEE